MSPVRIIADYFLVAAIARRLAWLPGGCIWLWILLSDRCCLGSCWGRAWPSTWALVGPAPVAGLAARVKYQARWARLLVGCTSAAVVIGCTSRVWGVWVETSRGRAVEPIGWKRVLNNTWTEFSVIWFEIKLPIDSRAGSNKINLNMFGLNWQSGKWWLTSREYYFLYSMPTCLRAQL